MITELFARNSSLKVPKLLIQSSDSLLVRSHVWYLSLPSFWSCTLCVVNVILEGNYVSHSRQQLIKSKSTIRIVLFAKNFKAIRDDHRMNNHRLIKKQITFGIRISIDIFDRSTRNYAQRFLLHILSFLCWSIENIWIDKRVSFWTDLIFHHPFQMNKKHTDYLFFSVMKQRISFSLLIEVFCFISDFFYDISSGFQ